MNQEDVRSYILRCRQLAHQEPKNPERHYDLGVALYEAADFRGALEAFERSRQVDAGFAKAGYGLGLTHWQLGDLWQAVESFAEAASLDEDMERAWAYLGNLRLELGDSLKAEQALRRAANLDPKNAATWKDLGLALFEQGKLEEAKDMLLKGNRLAKDDQTLERLGLTLSKLGRNEEALEAYKEALALEQGRGSLWSNLGNCQLKLQEVREAEDSYRQAIRLEPENPDFWFNLGELLYHYASKEEAIEPLSRALALNPDDLEALGLLGLAQAEARPDEARVTFESLHRAGNRDPKILSALAEIYQKNQETLKEIAIREDLAQQNPYDMHNNFAIAKLKLSQGEPETAYKLLGDCLSISEKEYQTWYKLAQSFQLERKLNEEFDCLEKVIQANPEHLAAWRRLGLLAMERGYPEKALLYFKKAADACENDFALWQELCYRLLQKNALEGALETLEQVLGMIRLSPLSFKELFTTFKRAGHLEALVERLEGLLFVEERTLEELVAFGDLLVRFGYFELAERLAHHAHERDPENPEAQYQLALFYQLKGDLDRAMEYYQLGLDANPADYDLLNGMGECHYQLQEWDEAKGFFTKAAQIRKDDYRVWFNLGNIALRQEDLERAREHYQASLGIYAKEPKTLSNLALVAEAEGEKEEARGLYQRALQVDRWDAYSWAGLGHMAMEEGDYEKARRLFLKSLASERGYKIAWNNLALVYVKLGEKDKTQSCLEELKRLKAKEEEESG